MKKCLLFLLILTVARTVPLMAQVPPPEEPDPATRQARVQRIEALKITFINQRLNLNKSESEQFWPLYFQYEKELHAATTSTYGDEISRERAVLSVHEKYQQQFSVVIGRNRSNYVFQSERDFNQMLLKQLNRPRPGARMGLRRGL